MRAGILALAALMSSGCVAKKKYTALEDSYEQLEKKNEKLETENQKLEATLERRQAIEKQRVEAFRELVRDFKPLVDRGILEVTVEDGKVLIGMKSDVLFASGSAELSADGKAAVTEVAKLLARRTDRKFQVEGHTDSDAISGGKFADNWELGSERALNVVRAMVAAGMSPAQVSAASFGQYAPTGSNSSDAGKAANRRIEVVLLPDLSDMPGYEVLLKEVGKEPRKMERGPPPGERPPRPPR
jgi:chemotaxis protein MotB